MRVDPLLKTDKVRPDIEVLPEGNINENTASWGDLKVD